MQTARGKHRFSLTFIIVFVLVLVVQGCASLPDRNPLPREKYAESRVLGKSDFRWWGSEPPPVGRGLVAPTQAELQSILPGFVGREVNFLAISGGGSNGAFAAGLLNGWTASDTRPEFTVVTGISTGALIAPFAYLGPAYDHVLKRLYTQYSTEDLVKTRGWLQAITSDASFDTAPLRSLLAEYVDEALVKAIAAEHRRGRWLFIGTTNLDAGRAVTWDIGAIANSGQPGALDLIRDVILASASIPVAFPPVMIEVEADGQRYDEMHVDGGATRQSFMFHLSGEEETYRNLNIIGTGRAYIIRNGKLESTWDAVDRQLFPIAGRSASTMIRKQGIGDLYREFIGAKKFGFDFNLAYIPSDFDADENELFDRDYMRKLYEFAYALAVDGYPWKKLPPALEANRE